jgi:hypothetical protein
VKRGQAGRTEEKSATESAAWGRVERSTGVHVARKVLKEAEAGNAIRPQVGRNSLGRFSTQEKRSPQRKAAIIVNHRQSSRGGSSPTPSRPSPRRRVFALAWRSARPGYFRPSRAGRSGALKPTLKISPPRVSDRILSMGGSSRSRAVAIGSQGSGGSPMVKGEPDGQMDPRTRALSSITPTFLRVIE